MSNGYLKFTGEFAKLKSMGYEFQKLFAANYMQWHKNGLRIFKRGSDITHGNIDLYKLVKFIRNTTSPDHVRMSEKHVSFYKFYSNADTNEYDYYPMTEENKKKYGDNMKQWGKVKDNTPKDKLPPYMTTEIVRKSMLLDLEELNKLGWYELAEYEPECKCDDCMTP